MPTFPRGHNHFLARLANAKRIAKLAPDQPRPKTSTHAHTEADGITLRGLPAIGRGVAGHIRDTHPENFVCR